MLQSMVVERSVSLNLCMSSVKETGMSDAFDTTASQMYSSACRCVLPQWQRALLTAPFSTAAGE